VEIILFLAAIAVAFIIFTWLVKIARATISTALTIALIVLVLLAFGIGPAQLWQELTQLFQSLWNLVTGSR
jgi:hypothetical protein